MISLRELQDRKVTLMMGDINIQKYLEYKGEPLTAAALNCIDVTKMAHVFVIQSLLSAHAH